MLRSGTAESDPQASHIPLRGVQGDTAAGGQCASRLVLKPCLWKPLPVGGRRARAAGFPGGRGGSSTRGSVHRAPSTIFGKVLRTTVPQWLTHRYFPLNLGIHQAPAPQYL